MSNFQDLPDELILKILSYSEIKDLITCGQVSKRTKKISHDSSLWMRVKLQKKIVKTELLEMILGKGCMILDLRDSTIIGCLSLNMKSQLRVLDLSQSARGWSAQPIEEDNRDALEELLFSCCSLQHLEIKGLYVTPKMVHSICKNAKTLQVLNLNHSFLDDRSYFQEIIKSCQGLKELIANRLNPFQNPL